MSDPFSLLQMILAHLWWVLMRQWRDVNLSLACVGTYCLWNPGDSFLLAGRQDLEHYFDFLLLHLREDKEFVRTINNSKTNLIYGGRIC